MDEGDARSFIGGEGSRKFGELILLFPPGGDSLPLGEEPYPALAIEIQIAGKRLLASGERKHRQGYRNGDIDSHLSALDLTLEFVGCRTRAGEDGAAVAPGVFVGELDCFLQGVHVYADQHRTEDLFLVNRHIWGHVGDDGRGDEVALRVFRVAVVRPVQQHLGAFLLCSSHQLHNSFL